MKTSKNVYLALSAIVFALTLSGPMAVSAATTPSLGTAATYGILTGTFNYNVGLTTITGVAGSAALGYAGVAPGGGASLTVTGTTQVNNLTWSTAGTAQGTALGLLSSQACGNGGSIPGYTFTDGAIDLAIDTTHGGTTRHYSPGVYCITGAMSIGTAGIVLDTPGTYIFRSTGAFDTTDTSEAVTLGAGVSACDVFWTPGAATTIHANNTFVGTVIDNAGITISHLVTWTGRALAYAAGSGVVTADTTTLTVPTCAVAASTPSTTQLSTINVVKTVINDNGGTKTVADFPLFVNGTAVVSGVTNNFHAPDLAYTITETSDTNYYTRTFSGDCDVNGQLNLVHGDNKFCIITNNDIGAPAVVPPVPPLIDVVKVPSPLSLPDGPGKVNYTYTLRNIGTVPVSNITMVGDTCSPIVLASGDVNIDAKLDVNETWIYRCSTTLTATHTNTVVATGWANGISATDIASATVVVGAPVVPPLIHVTKTPNPLTLPARGGMVTYTEKITNPGTVALSNVRLNDDKCSPMKYISGDSNGDAKLDPSETWTYTCRVSLTKTTMNTAVASGEANGLSVRDFAIATVVVTAAVPGLPNTGLVGLNTPWGISIIAIILALLIVSAIIILKKRGA